MNRMNPCTHSRERITQQLHVLAIICCVAAKLHEETGAAAVAAWKFHTSRIKATSNVGVINCTPCTCMDPNSLLRSCPGGGYEGGGNGPVLLQQKKYPNTQHTSDS